MAGWGQSSAGQRSRSSASRATSTPGMKVLPVRRPLGKETGLPLIKCPRCFRTRVIELKAKIELNLGQIFFKCPFNIEDMPGRCRFYEWQKEYLEVLIRKGNIVMNFDDVEEAPEEVIEEVNSVANPAVFDLAVQTCALEGKIDKLTWAVKLLGFMLAVVVVLVCVRK